MTHVAISPAPVQAPLPVWLPAWRADAARLARALGLPLLGAPFSSLRELDACYGDATRGAAAPGRRIVPVIRELHIAPTTQAALSVAEQVLARRYQEYRRLGLVTENAESFEALARDRFIIGDPDRCLREIERYRDAIGLTYLVCRPGLPSANSAGVEQFLALAARTLLPNLRMVGYPGAPEGDATHGAP